MKGIQMASVATPQNSATQHDVVAQEDAVSSRFWVLLTASLVSSLIMLDSNIVAVSLPAIGRSLNASFTDAQWVISAYVLAYAALLMSYCSTHPLWHNALI
jgi:hypothetical protein